MKSGFCPATTVPGSSALPFVISPGAQRSGEICGLPIPKRLLRAMMFWRGTIFPHASVTERCLHKKHRRVPFIPHLQKRVTGAGDQPEVGSWRVNGTVIWLLCRKVNSLNGNRVLRLQTGRPHWVVHHRLASWALSPMMSYWDSFAPVRTCPGFPSFQTATAAPAGCFQTDPR